LYEAFAPAEARRLMERLEIHFMPKHGSWLNMAETELSVLATQCLDRRIPDSTTLQTGPGDHLHQCGLKPTVLDWCKSSPINASTIACRCPRFPLRSMVAHCTEVSGVQPTYLRTRAKDVAAMFATLTQEVAAWERQRNTATCQVNWRFTTHDARIKLKRLYLSIQLG
jgi:hypothetical protein